MLKPCLKSISSTLVESVHIHTLTLQTNAKIYLWSDLHADFAQNRAHLLQSCIHGYKQDVLILAGDISDRLDYLEQVLAHFKHCFAQVFFVPGNHELWLRQNDLGDSWAKLEQIESLCRRLGIYTSTQIFSQARGENQQQRIALVPLLSWYDDSLRLPKSGEDPDLSMWADRYRVRWSGVSDETVCKRLLSQSLNEKTIAAIKTADQCISFSHFLPNISCIFGHSDYPAHIDAYDDDPVPSFNFTRVAGSSQIQAVIDSLDSDIHAYGHQHRNRQLDLSGCQYVSHCMGYPEEPKHGPTGNRLSPLRLWPNSVD